MNPHLARDGWALVEVDNISGYPIFGPQRRERLLLRVSDDFPLDMDEVLSSVAEILKQRGAARDLAVLGASSLEVEQESYDNWDGGTYGWKLTCKTPTNLYSRLSRSEREEAEAALSTALDEVMRGVNNHHFQKVLVVPASAHTTGWREEAQRFVSGAGTNNQGRVRTDNIASLECDGLLFRSQPEINLYRAFKAAGVTFAPLPVFIRGGTSYARLEPDFVLMQDGVVLVVEVDGDTYHQELPADAHARLVPLDREGAKIERVRAQACATPEEARACAKGLIAVMKKVARRR